MTGSSPRMIGRDAELGVLRDAFAAGRDRHPRVVVVRGEAGIGKTRLLRDFTAEAAAAPGAPPVVVASGQCVDIGEIGAPFTPIRRLLRELSRAVGDEAFRAAARTPAVIATLGALLPDLAPDTTAPVLTGAEFVTEAIERVIEELSADRHLVLVIEDLHWADTATIALLKTLSVTLRGSHVTIVMTYRSDDVGRGHPLRPLLADLERNRAVTTVEVRRLDIGETTALARLVRTDLAEDAVAAIAARSDGVPFFIEELVDLDDAELPETLRGLVLARYERLSDPAAEVVGAVAAAGVHAEHDVLEQVYDGTAGALRDGLREALAANVLVADGDGYAFRHALIQESVHADLLPSERAGLHRRYATALATRVAAGQTHRAAEVAEHWLQARDIPRAFESTVAARAHAKATHATVSAAQLGERLLELWPQVPDAEALAGMPLHVLATTTAAEWSDLSQPGRAVRILRAALPHAGDDRVGRALVHRQAAVALANLSRLTEAFDEVQAGIALVEGAEGPGAATATARLLGTALAIPEHIVGGPDARADFYRRALASIERTDDLLALHGVLTLSAWFECDHGDFASALDKLHRVRTLALSPAETLNTILGETDTLMHMGRFDDAIEQSELGIDMAAQHGLERGVGGMIASNLAESLFARGRAERARAILDDVLSWLTAPPFRSFALRLQTTSAVWDDDTDAAEVVMAREAQLLAEVRVEDPEEVIGWTMVRAEAALNAEASTTDPARRRDRLTAAADELRTLDVAHVVETIGIARRLVPVVARCAAAVAAAGSSTGSPEESSEAVADLTALLDAIVAGIPDDGPSASYRALVAAEGAPASEAAGRWRAAAATLADGYVPVRYLHYARFRLAEALVAADERAEAAAVLNLIVDEAPRHGVGLVARWARELAARAGIALETTDAGTREQPASAASGVSSLTPRELQVLALVAEGLTNPQIGQRLFISPKTASVHVSSILAKIGARGRAEAAALYSARSSD